jgi:hypothetical protein
MLNFLFAACWKLSTFVFQLTSYYDSLFAVKKDLTAAAVSIGWPIQQLPADGSERSEHCFATTQYKYATQRHRDTY